MRALFEPRMATHGVSTVRAYCEDMLRYTNAETVTRITCPTFVTDNETDLVSTGQGQVLYDHLTCPKDISPVHKAEGAEGHCEGMAPTVFWDAAYNWLDTLLSPIASRGADNAAIGPALGQGPSLPVASASLSRLRDPCPARPSFA